MTDVSDDPTGLCKNLKLLEGMKPRDASALGIVRTLREAADAIEKDDTAAKIDDKKLPFQHVVITLFSEKNKSGKNLAACLVNIANPIEVIDVLKSVVEMLSKGVTMTVLDDILEDVFRDMKGDDLIKRFKSFLATQKNAKPQ